MSAATSTLPADWSNILDDVRARLDAALATADARMAEAPSMGAEPLTQERGEDYARLCARLQRLSGYLASAEQIVQSVDEVLQQEQQHIQNQLTACESLRRKVG